MKQFSFSDANELLKQNIRSFLSELYSEGVWKDSLFSIGDVDGTKPTGGGSLKVPLSGRWFGTWKDFDTGDGGDLLELLVRRKKISKTEALKWVQDRYAITVDRGGDKLPPKKKNSDGWLNSPDLPKVLARTKPVQVWPILDEKGNLLCYDSRSFDKKGKKRHIPCSRSPSEKWELKWPSPLPLYGLEEMAKHPQKPILLCEGPKTKDAAHKIQDKYIAAAFLRGTNAWQETDYSPLYGRNIILAPDADGGGRLAMLEIAGLLFDKCPSIHLMNTKDLGEDGWDLADLKDKSFDQFIKGRLVPLKEEGIKTSVAFIEKMIEKLLEKYPKLKRQKPRKPKEASNEVEKIEIPEEDDGPVASPEEAGFFFIRITPRGVKKTPDLYGLSKFLREKYFLKTSDGFMYIWEDGYYKSLSPQGLEKLILVHTKEQCDASSLKDFSKICRADNHINFENFQVSPGYLNLKNGILNVHTQEIVPHSPDFPFKYKLPHEYKQDAYPSKWLNFLFETFEGKNDLIDLSAEIFGYTLIGGDPWLHKAFILLGDGRNGKSTYIDVLKYLLGPANVCAIPIQNLGKPFSVVTADGKLANIVGETTASEVDSEVFKTAVSGEELTAARKNRDEYFLKFQARLFFACNKMPVFKDTTSGNTEKLCIIPFARFLKKEERIPEFARRFLYPEISGIINWAIEGYKRLKERERLPELPSLEETLKDYKSESNSVYAWFEENFEANSESSSRIYFTEQYQSYLSYCDRNHITNRVSKVEFGRRCKQIIFTEHPYIFTERDKKGFFMTGGYFKQSNVYPISPGRRF